MTKLIGITAYSEGIRQKLNSAYINAFSSDDVTPIIIPVYPLETAEIYNDIKTQDKTIHALTEKLDALVLSGGGDINPLTYNANNKKSFSCNTTRDYMEVRLAESFIKRGKPVMGICRGFQLLGMIHGFGNFIQDLSKVKGELHAGAEVDKDKTIGARNEPLHSVKLFGDFRQWLIDNTYINDNQDHINVNSWHHQGFSILAEARHCTNRNLERNILRYGNRHGVEIIASTNKIIEGFKHLTKPIVGFQYHPEEYDSSFTIDYFVNKYVLKL